MEFSYEHRFYEQYGDPNLTCTPKLDQMFLGEPLQPAGIRSEQVIFTGLVRSRQGLKFSYQDFTLHLFVDYRPDGKGLVANARLISKTTHLVSWMHKAQLSIQPSKPPFRWFDNFTLVLGFPEKPNNVPEKLRTIATCASRLQMRLDRDNYKKWTRAYADLYCDGGDPPVLKLSSNL